VARAPWMERNGTATHPCGAGAAVPVPVPRRPSRADAMQRPTATAIFRSEPVSMACPGRAEAETCGPRPPGFAIAACGVHGGWALYLSRFLPCLAERGSQSQSGVWLQLHVVPVTTASSQVGWELQRFPFATQVVKASLACVLCRCQCVLRSLVPSITLQFQLSMEHIYLRSFLH
jgi:hypothetical protein